MADNTFIVNMKVVGDISDARSNIESLQKSFGKLKLPDKISGNLNKKITEFYKEYEKYQKKISEGVKTQGDYNQVEKSLNRMRSLYQEIGKEAGKVTKLDLSELIDMDSGNFKQIANDIKNTLESINKVKVDPKKLTSAFDQIKNVTKNTKITGENGILGQLIGHLKTGEIEQAKKKLQELQAYAQKVRTRETADGKHAPGTLSADNYSALTGALQTITSAFDKAEAEADPFIQKLKELQTQLEKDKVAASKDILGNADQFKAQEKNVDSVTESLKRMHEEEFNFNRQAQDIDRQIQSYFGLSQMIRKVGDIARDAFATVKELDKAMTETAVVTNFSVGDMWDMLPTYTAQANQLGSTIRDVYEAATLYYQQGLNTNQAMGLANETLKMARIAGLGAAEATDMMTAALRGFNMEINQQSAQKINDIYSELAAITASDTAEIGSAMERTASIANSANMEFATTSAFLAQMIETTREAPENLGTAMKTIVARFQEMKQDPTKLIDSEGVAMDANKVDKALKTIGVNLMNTKGEFRDLDDVFLDIASKWDSLSQGQQRYIATIAAGSRQQSRFIAMMSNYERTMELVDAANNSAGASQRQFEKTLDSMEAKLNKLKNAWDQFTMGLMNNQILKFGVDALTEGFTIVNKFIDILGKIPPKPFEGITKSILTLVTTLGMLNFGKKASRGLVMGGAAWWKGEEGGFGKNFMSGFSGQAAKAGSADGQAYARNFKAAISKGKFKDAFDLTKRRTEQLKDSKQYENTAGAAFAPFSATQMTQAIQAQGTDSQIANEIRNLFQRACDMVDSEQIGREEAQELASGLAEDVISGKADFADAAGTFELATGVDINKMGVNELPTQKVNELSNSFMAASASLQSFGMALQDTPLAPFGTLLSKIGMLLSGFGGAISWVSTTWTAGITTATGATLTGTAAMQAGFSALFAEIWAFLTTNPIGWILLAIAGIAAAIKGLDLLIESNAEKLEAATDAAAAASEAYDSAKQETSELADAITQIQETDSAFDGLVAGTAEFNEQLITANEQILALIDKYPMLNDSKFLSTDKNGLMHINEEGFKAVKEYQKQIQARASAMNLIQTADLNAIENQQKADNLRKVRGAMSTEEYQKNLRDADLLEQRIEAEKQLARQNAIRTNLVNKEIANQEKLASIYVDQYEAKRQAAELEVASLNKQDIRQRYADYHGYTYEKSTKKMKDVEGNEIDYDDAAIKDEVIEQTVMLDFEANASSLEGILNQIDRDFNHSLNGAFENSSTFISDVLSNNAEANEDLLEQILDNPKQLNDFVEGLSTKEIAAVLGVTESAVESNVSSYQKQLEDKLLSNAQNIIDTNAQANGELAAMLAQAQGQDANAVLISKNLQKGLMQQVTDFTTQQKNTLLNIGKTLESSVGSDAMATFVDGLSKIYRSNDEQLKTVAQDWIESINWETATGRLKGYNEAINMTVDNTERLGKEGVKQMNDLGKAMLESKDEANLLGQAFEEFYNSTDFQEMAENMDKFVDSSGQLNAASVMDMAEECHSLNNLLDTGAISAGGVATALNALGSDGKLVLSDLNTKVLELLSNFGQLDDIIASSHRNIENFDWGIDTGEAEDFVKESAEKWNELYKNGEVGNPQLEAYAKWVMGEDKYIALLASKNGDLAATMKEVSKTVNKYSDGFETAWDDLASGEWKNVELSDNLKDLGISFSFDNEGNWEWNPGSATTAELQQWLQEVKGIGPEMAQAFMETWSNLSPDFRAERQKNDFAAGLDSYINERRGTDGGVSITSSELNTIAASTGQSLDEVKSAIIDRAGINESQLHELENINKNTGEYITDGAILNKQLTEAIGAKGQNGWLSSYTAKDSKNNEILNSIDIESAMAGAVERGYTAAQAKSMAYESYTNADKQNKDYYYKGELIEAGKYKTLDQFAERLAEIDQNAQWTKVGQAIADGFLNRVDEKDSKESSETDTNTGVWGKSGDQIRKTSTNSNDKANTYQGGKQQQLTWEQKVPGWVAGLIKALQNPTPPPKQEDTGLTGPQQQKTYGDQGGINQTTSQLNEAGTNLNNAGTTLNSANIQLSTAAQQLTVSTQQLSNAASQLNTAANTLNQKEQNQNQSNSTTQYAPGAPSNIPQNQSLNQKSTITIENTDANAKLNETKQLAVETRDTINQGATFNIEVPGVDKLNKAAQSAKTISSNSGDKVINVKTNKVDTQSVSTAAKGISKTKANIQVGANTTKAISEAAKAKRKIDDYKATIDVSTNVKGQNVDIYVTKHVKEAAKGLNNKIKTTSIPNLGSLAKGTRYGRLGPKGRGGLTLTGEEGFEIAWLPDESKSMILGANGPQMINLPANAVVYTHEQSKDILKKRQTIDAGSHSKVPKKPKGTNSSGSSGKSGNSGKSGKGEKGKKGKTTKYIEDKTKKLFEKVDVWWDNFSRRAEARQRAIDKATKTFEKSLKGITGTSKNAQIELKKYQTALNASIQENTEGYNHAIKQLQNLDNGVGDDALAAISYSYTQVTKTKKKGRTKTKKEEKSKEEWVNLGEYVKFDAKSGAYQVDQDKLNTIANLEKRKAIADAANQKINDWVGKANNAQDAITKAQEELEKAADTMYETFDAWEKSINEIYVLSKQLELLSGLKDFSEGVIELQSAMLKTGYQSISQGHIAILQALTDKNNQLQSQINASNLMLTYQQKKLEDVLNIDTYYDKYAKNPNSAEAKDQFDAAREALNLYNTFGGDMEKITAEALKKFNDKEYNENFYNKVKQVLDDIATAQTDVIKTAQDSNGLAQEIFSMLEEANTFIIDFKNSMLEGLEEQTENEINRLDKLNTSLTKTLKSLLDEIKRKLDERKEQEDNAKTESDISKKQQRLAALQADTSGGHQLEIAQLQQEITEIQQSYQRSLEDQLLEKLQNQADQAAEQRERQIELLQAQRDIATASGITMKEIEDLLLQAREGSQEEKQQAEKALREIYRNSQHYYDKNTSTEDKARIDNEFDEKFATYGAYMDLLPQLKTSALQNTNNATITTAAVQTATTTSAVAETEKSSVPVAPAPAPAQAPASKPASASVPALQKNSWDVIKSVVNGLSVTAGSGPKFASGANATAATHSGNKALKMNSGKWDASIDKYGQITWHDGTGVVRQYNLEQGKIWTIPYTEADYRNYAGVKTNKSKGNEGGKDTPGKRGKTWQEYYEALKHRNSKKYPKKYKTGGLADYTGPAWLDGTPSKPELVLNSTDTKNFIALKDVLSKAMGSTNAIENTYGGDTTFEININVDHLNNDYDVDKVAERVKKIIVKDSSYRNVTQVRNFR